MHEFERQPNFPISLSVRAAIGNETNFNPINTNYQLVNWTYEVDVRLREDVLGLHQLSGVARVEEVVDAVGVDSDLPGRQTFLSHLGGDLSNKIIFFIDRG